MKKIDKETRSRQVERFLAPARTARKKLINTSAKFIREHRALKYPMYGFLFVFLFVYNLILYIIQYAHVEKKMVRATALLLVLAMILCQMPSTGQIAKAGTTSSTLSVGAFNYASGKFSSATGAGSDTYASLSIGLNYASGASIGVSLPTVDGFTLSSSSTAYTKIITLTNKTASQIADYIKQITFSGYQSYGFSVSFTVEKQKESITPAHYSTNDHYYLYVPYASTATTDDRTWTKAYETAKSYTYCGQTGYLATITSKAEEDTIQAITGGGTGWLGGTRMPGSSATATTCGAKYYSSFDLTGNYDYNYWYWACGPERGEKFFSQCSAANITSYANEASSYYFNWNCKGQTKDGEPNGAQLNNENCLTILTLSGGVGYQTRGVNCWNDIVYNRPYSTSDGYCPTGFIVEFGSEKNSFGSTTRLYDACTIAKHSHDWSYTVSADKKSISTSCISTLGTCTSYNGNTYALSIDASDTDYTGSKYDVSSKLKVVNNITSGTGSGKVTDCSVSSVYYKGITEKGTTYAESTTAPTKAGYYTAYIKITNSGKISSVSSTGEVTRTSESFTIQDDFTIKDSAAPNGSVKVAASEDTNTWEDSLLSELTSPSKINFYSGVPTVTLDYSDKESNVSKVEYFYTTDESEDLTCTLDELKAKTDWTTYYSLLEPTQEANSFDLVTTKGVVYVKITDIFGNVSYISSDIILVDEAAVEAYKSAGTVEEEAPVAAWYSTDEETGNVTVNYGTLQEAIEAANAGTGVSVIVRPGVDSTTATSSVKADNNVSVYIPEETSVSIAGDAIVNPATEEDTYVTVSTDTSGNNLVATEVGQKVSINDTTYTNASTGSEEDASAMFLTVDSDDQVVLTDGKINLDNNEEVYVERDGNKVLITNSTAGDENKAIVVTPAYGSNTDNKVKASEGATVTIKETSSSGINTNTYTAASDSATITLTDAQTDPILTKGSVDVASNSTINLTKVTGTGTETITEYVSVTAGASSTPEVSSSGSVEFDSEEVVKINGTAYTYTAASDNTKINVTKTLNTTEEATETVTPVLTAGSLTLADDPVYVENSNTDGDTTISNYSKVSNTATAITEMPTVSADGSVSLCKNDSVSLTTYTDEGTVTNSVTADGSNTENITVSTSVTGVVETSVKENQGVEINGQEYTSTSDSTVISTADDTATPKLIAGQVEVSKDSTIQVKSAQVTTTGTNNATVSANGDIELENDSKVSVKDTVSNQENIIIVADDGIEEDSAITLTADEIGNVNVSLEKNETITINDNTYTGATDNSDGQGSATGAEIKVDLSQASQTLTEGAVDLTRGSEINVEITSGEGSDQTTTTTTITSANNTQPTVSASGSVELPDSCTVETTTDGKTTEISTPAASAESSSDDKTIVQLTGTSMEVSLNDNKEITVGDSSYKAKSDETTIDIGSNGATLTSGSVELEKDDSINVNGTSVTNVGSESSKLVVGINTESATGQDDGSASIQVEAGESYRIGEEGIEEGYVFTNNNEPSEEIDTTTYKIDKDGNLILSGEDIPVTVGGTQMHIGGVSDGSDDAEVTAKVIEDGIEVTAEPGEDVKITNAAGDSTIYKNGGDEDENLVLLLKEDGKVYLDEGNTLPQGGGAICVEQSIGDGMVKSYSITNEGGDDSISVERSISDGVACNQVTFNETGAKITLKDSTTTSTYTATTENTSILLTEGTPKLEAGGLSLGSGSKLAIKDTGLQIKNAGNESTSVSAERKTVEGEEVTELSISAGGTARISNPGADETVAIQIKNNGSDAGTYVLKDDGTVSVSDKDELTISGGSQGDVVITPSENSKVEVKVESDQVAVTIPSSGDSISLNVGDTTSVLTAKTDDVDLIVKDGTIILNDGTVDLSEDAKLTVGSKNRTYTNIGSSEVEISMDESTDTGSLTLSGGAAVSLGSTGNITIKNVSDTEATSLAINDDGSLILAAEDELALEIKGSQFKIKADGDLNIDITENENSTKFTIPSGKTITITDSEGVEHTYSNNGTEDLVISLDKDGDIALLSGAISLSNGESVYMTDAQGKKVLVVASGTEPIMIGQDGEIVIPTGATAVIGGNQYTGATEAASGETGKARVKFGTDGGAPILTEGQVNLAPNSKIAKEITVNEQTVVAEITNTTDGEATDTITVGSQLTIGQGQSAKITVSDQTYNLEVPENGGTAEVSFEASGSSPDQEIKLGLEVTPEEGQTNASMKINDGTYSAVCTESGEADKKLALNIDGDDGQIRLDNAGVSEVSVSNGSLIVGQETITTGDVPVLIKQTQSEDSLLPEITIPAGGQVEVIKNDSTSEPIKVTVPEDGNPVTVATLSDGDLGVSLEDNQILEINGATITADGDDAQLKLSDSTPELIKGSVDLGSNAQIKVGESVITNNGSDENAISVSMIIPEGQTEAVPQISVPSGGSYSVTKADATGSGSSTITFQNTGDEECNFTLNSDGTMEIPAGTTVPVSINGKTAINLSGDGALNTLITDEGVELSTETGNTINVGASSYKSISDDCKLLLNENGKVELTDGQVELIKNTQIILDIDGSDNTITNTSAEAGKAVDVNKDGTITFDNGASAKVQINGKTQTYTAKEEDTSLTMAADSMTLNLGAVALGSSSAVDVANGDSTITYSNPGSTGSVDVKKDEDGNISLGLGAGSSIEMASKSENAKYKVNLTNSGSDEKTYTVDSDGYVTAGAGDVLSVKQTTGSNAVRITPSASSTVKMCINDDSVDLKLDSDNELSISGVAGNSEGSTLKATESDTQLSISDSGIELKNGGVELSEGSKIVVGHSSSNAGMAYKSIGGDGENQSEALKVTYDEESKTGLMTIPADQGVEVSLPTSSTAAFKLINQDEAAATALDIDEDGSLILPASTEESASAITLAFGDKTFQIQTQVGGSGVKFRASTEGAQLVVAAGETVVIDGKEYTNSGTGDLIFTIDSKGSITINSGEITVTANETIQVKNQDGTVSKITAENGNATISRTVDEAGNATVDIATSSEEGVNAIIKINDSTYAAVADSDTSASLSLSLNGQTKEVKLNSDSIGEFNLTNGSLTVGNTVISTSGDLPVEINRPSTKDEPTMKVASGENVTIGNTTTGKSVELILPEDCSEKEVSLNNQTGSISVNVEEGETLTVGGVTYTVGAESGKLVVDSQTGQLNTLKTEVTPEVSIDPENFNKANYTYTLKKNQTVKIGDKEYKATSGNVSIAGNSSGNPIISADNGSRITIGEETFEAAAEETMFTLTDDSEVKLIDNGKTPNSTVKFSGTKAKTVDGVQYQMSTEEGSFTLSYSAYGDTLTVPEKSAVSVKLQANETIYTADGKYIKATGDGVALTVAGNKITCQGNTKLTNIEDASGNVLGYEAKVVVPDEPSNNSGDNEEKSKIEDSEETENTEENTESEANNNSEESKDSANENKDNNNSEKSKDSRNTKDKNKKEASKDKSSKASNDTSSKTASANSSTSASNSTSVSMDNKITGESRDVDTSAQSTASEASDEVEVQVKQVDIENVSEGENIDITTQVTQVNYGDGSVSMTSENTEATISGHVSEVLEACFSEDELEAIRSGSSAEVNLKVELIKSDSETETDYEKQIRKAVDGWQEGIDGLTYLDGYEVLLTKNFNGEGWQTITNLSTSIAIEFTLEDGSPACGATCYAVRNHEGDCDLLEDEDDSDSTITIRTDRFSTYGIAYIANDVAVVAAAASTTGTEFPWWIFVILATLILIATRMMVCRRKY